MIAIVVEGSALDCDVIVMLARSIAVQLSCASRVAFQANRLALGPLMVYMAAENNMSVAEKGQVMSAFPLGYLLTQVIYMAFSMPKYSL